MHKELPMRTFLIAAGMLIATSPTVLPAQTILDRLERALDRVIDPQSANPVEDPNFPSSPPHPRSAYLGVVGTTTRDGVRITAINPGSLADNAGLRIGDVITMVNDQPTRSVPELLGVLQVVTSNKLAIQFRRGSQNVLVKVPFVDQAAPALATPDALDRASLGVTVVDITEPVKEQFGVLLRRGAVVSRVVPGSSADRADLPIGSVIVAVDGRRVDSANDLVQIIARSRAGQEAELTYYQGTRLTRKIVVLMKADQIEVLPGPVPVDPPFAGAVPLPSDPALAGEPPLTSDAPPSRPILDALERAIGQGNQITPQPTPSELPQPRVATRPNLPVEDSNALLLAEIRKLQEQVEELTKRLEAVEAKQIN
ncbi:MAG: serine protease Do [Pirellulaceae bacterium]|jgi:serine protease Do